MHVEDINYYEGDTLLKGHLVTDKHSKEKRPGILVAHAWDGRNQFYCDRAKAIFSEFGYVSFAMDVYGNGRIGETKDEKMALMTSVLDDRALLRARLLSALATLKKCEQIDSNKIAVIGYCFGGLCALELARSGADIKGVVSFHGTLGAPENLKTEVIKAKVLALHGHDDPLVPVEAIRTFEDEMTKEKVDWQLHIYGHTFHSFTNPEANNLSFGTVYNKQADTRSWKAMKNFLTEIFS